MSLKRPCVVALLLAFPCASLAQTGRITGRSLLANGSPVGSVVVTLLGTTRSAVTVSSGEFTLDDVPVGSYSIRALRLGVGPSVQQVVVMSGQTTEVTFILNAVALPPALISFGEPSTPLPPDSIKLPVPDSVILRSRQSEGSLPFNPSPGQRFRLELFARPGVILEIEQTTAAADGIEAVGSIISEDGVRSGLVTVVVRQGRVIANIRHGLRLYMIRPQPRNIHLLVEVDLKKLPGEDSLMAGGPAS